MSRCRTFQCMARRMDSAFTQWVRVLSASFDRTSSEDVFSPAAPSGVPRIQWTRLWRGSRSARDDSIDKIASRRRSRIVFPDPSGSGFGAAQSHHLVGRSDHSRSEYDCRLERIGTQTKWILRLSFASDASRSYRLAAWLWAASREPWQGSRLTDCFTQCS